MFTGIDFPEGNNLQYISAFQRGNFWQYTNGTDYGLELDPTVINGTFFNVLAASGVATEVPEIGGCVGKVRLDWFFGQLLDLISRLPQIQPNTLPIFLTNNVFLINPQNAPGYHSSIPSGIGGGVQTWVWATYNDLCPASAPCLGQDVSELSHEVAEWADDPFGHTPTPCGANSFLEVADPLIDHFYTYVVNGFTYDLQDLVFLPYFGAPNISYNPWSFQGETLKVCGQ